MIEVDKYSDSLLLIDFHIIVFATSFISVQLQPNYDINDIEESKLSGERAAKRSNR